MNRAIQGELFAFLRNNVDDTAGALCIKFGAWIGDDFDTLNHACRETVEGIGALVTHKGGGTAVNQNGDVFIAAKGYVSVDVHGHVGNLSENVRTRTTGHLQVAGHVVNLTIQAIEHGGAFRHDVSLLEYHGGIQSQFYSAHIYLYSRCSLHALTRGRITKGGNSEASGPGG